MPALARQRAPLSVILAAAVLLAAIVAWWLPGQVYRPAPEVTFQLLDGRTLAPADWRGRMVLINFWATTCPPCIEELPDLRALYHGWHARGLEIIAVAMPYDPPNYVQAFQKRHRLPYPIALDVSGEVMRAFQQVRAVPTSFLINPEGEVVLEHVGRIDRARVERLLRRYLDSDADDV